MIRYFAKALWMHLQSGRMLYVLTLFGVALGVASVVCIQILNRNALSAFSGGIQAVSGDADCSVVGRMPDLDEALFPMVLAQRDVDAAWPIYEADVLVESRRDISSDADEPADESASSNPLYLQVVGFDFFAPARVPITRIEDDSDGDASAPSGDILSIPGWIAIAPALAEEQGWSVGDTFRVSSGSRVATLYIGALVDFQKYVPLASRKLVVMDIAQAQNLLGEAGRIHRIDVRFADGSDVPAAAERLRNTLGPSAQVLTPEQREQDAAGLLAAFRLNLTALSLISLFVGVFLIYASVQASLVRRRPELGLLRSLGATERQVVGIILAEVLLLGALGTAVGLPLGYWVATQNVEIVSATLTNIYLLQEIEQLRIPPFVYALGVLVGIGGSVAGAIGPAIEMGRSDTRALLVSFSAHERTSRFAGPLALAGLALLLLSLLWYRWFGEEVRFGGFVLGFFTLVAIPLVAPWIIREIAERMPVQGLGVSLSVKNLAVRLQTTAVSAAALGVAVSMLLGITILIGSFRRTLETWVDSSIRADIYISAASWARAGSEATLSDGILARLASLEEIRAIESLRQFPVYAGDRRIKLGGLSMALPDSAYHMPLRNGDASLALQAMRSDGAAIISEPLARKAHLGVGDTLQVTAPAGEVRFPIAGVSYDYSSEAGAALISLATMERFYGRAPVSNVALFLKDPAQLDHVLDRIRQALPDAPLEIRSNAAIRREIFRIFDQTFAITRLLQAMALLIAAAGVTLTLLVLARERVAELALYRALGAHRSQIFRIFVGEGLGIGIFGLTLGALGGLALALILIHVINPAFFGWTIHARWPWGEMLRQAAVILAVCAFASLYPALRATRVPASELSRDEL